MERSSVSRRDMRAKRFSIWDAATVPTASRSRKKGGRCVGCDINLRLSEDGASSGLPAVAAEGPLPFPDKSFDTVLLFEVIEHVPPIEAILKEAFRVARKNVLVTVPNAEDLELLKGNDVTYAHMLSSDHVHFFDPDGFLDCCAVSGQRSSGARRSDLSVLVSQPVRQAIMRFAFSIGRVC